MLLNINGSNEQIKIEIKEYIETNDNNNTKPQLLWDTLFADDMILYIKNLKDSTA